MKKSSTPPNQAAAPPVHAPSPLGWAIGLALLGVAAAAAWALAVQGILGLALPGCGPASPCASVAAGKWGSLPGLGWPVSFIGAAYFSAALVAWAMARRGLSVGGLWALRLGGLVSLGFLTIAVVESLFCTYCLIANGANLLFWALAEATRPSLARTPTWRGLPVGVALFATISAALGLWRLQAGRAAEQTAERERAKAEQAIVAPTPPGQPVPNPAPNPAPQPTTAATAPTTTTAPPPLPPAAPATPPLTGRWRLGPAEAPVRIVVFTDYQCPDCKDVERDLDALARANPERIALSIKYFPFCTDCNPKIGRNLHPNACWAARAAEAAGLLGGPEAFWRMHRWLFARAGSFTDAELKAGLAELGLSDQTFIPTMSSAATLAAVKADIDDGYRLGLFYTPMIFINGVELKGWKAKDAVRRTVEAALARNLPALGPENDRPPLALDRAIADWREGGVFVQPDATRPAFGPAPDKATATIVVFGDYQEPGCARADAAVRALLAARPDVRYEFRLFPVDQTCNPRAPRTLFPAACTAARAATAARLLGGSDGGAAWRAMHTWLFNNRDRTTPQTLADGAPALGLDANALSIAMQTSDATALLNADIETVARLGIGSIPAIFVSGRQVPRWELDGQSLLDRILDEAAPKKP
jgi:protein-disulfide isomerase/uncharacterized membrane protein